jgi:hypothetical protein
MNKFRRKLLDDINLNMREESITNRHWITISVHPGLSEEFIREFSDKLDWTILSQKQKFTDEFILEFKHLIDLDYCFIHNKVGFPIIKKFIPKTTFRSIYDFKVSHLSDIQKKEIQRLIDFKRTFKKIM